MHAGKIVLVSRSKYTPEIGGALLRQFVEDKIELFCAVGVDASTWEDALDWLWLRKLFPLPNLGTAISPMKLRSCMREADLCLAAQPVKRFVEWTHNGGHRGRHFSQLSAPLRPIHGQR
jgi:hypothetical protein